MLGFCASGHGKFLLSAVMGTGVNIGGCLPRVLVFVLILGALIALVVIVLGAATDKT